MNTLTFDTHGFVKRLTAAGMPEPQAEVLAEEQTNLIENNLATKRDLKELEATLKRDLVAEIRGSELRMVKWLIPLLLGQAALVAALVKLL